MLGMRREKEANQKREEVEGDPRDGKGGWGGGLQDIWRALLKLPSLDEPHCWLLL